MYLTREQERILSGEYGWVYSKALELIVKVGEALGAEKLVPVAHAHVSGISYSNIGEPGLQLIRDFHARGARARVYASTNPSCIDLSGYSKIISSAYRDKQLELNKYLEEIGLKPTYTCIPYIHRKPRVGEHLAWAESSAVIYANSVLGAYTNREGGPLALASALTGYTYYSGLHLLENRIAGVKVVVEAVEPGLYGALGLWLGENVKEVPIITGVTSEYSYVKLMLAAAAASGDHGLVVIESVTPKNTYIVESSVERIHVTRKDVEEYVGEADPSLSDVLGYVGCPHLDPLEFEYLVEFVRKRGRLPGKRRLLVSVPAIYSRIYRSEIEFLSRMGVDVAVGTCPIVSRLAEKPELVVTNSGKAAFYLKRVHGLRVGIMGLSDILKMVYSGV